MRIINKIFIKDFNFKIIWPIIVPIIALCAFGLVLLRSTSYDSSYIIFYKQLVWVIIGTSMFLLIQFIRLRIFNEYAYHLYVLLIAGLLLTNWMPIRGGAQRWIILGPLSIQPSEIGKIILVFTLAKFLSDRKDDKNQLQTVIYSIAASLIPALLVFKQPDLGTAIIYLAITFPMLYWVGIRPYYLFIFIAPVLSILTSSYISSFYIWMFLLLTILFYSQPKIKDAIIIFSINILCGLVSPIIYNEYLFEHQRRRLEIMIDPFKDPNGAGYQVIQSIISIGSGGLSGKGFNQGTQNHLKYLPVRDTDFIVSVAGEEFGLIGISMIILFFGTFLYWVMQYLSKINNDFSSLTLVGTLTILFVHLVVNMGMTVGLFPVTGLPAPFLSYGGTFMIVCLIMIGIINNTIRNNI